MALSSGGAALITGGINAVGSFFSTRGVAKAAKQAAKAQVRLIDLQAEEQRLRNQALRASLSDQNQRLPFAVSNPSLPAGAFSGNVAPSSAARIAAPQTAGPGATLTLGLAVLAFLGLAMMKTRAA